MGRSTCTLPPIVRNDKKRRFSFDVNIMPEQRPGEQNNQSAPATQSSQPIRCRVSSSNNTYYRIASSLFSTGRGADLDELFIAAARDGDYERIENFLQQHGDVLVNVDAKDKRTGNTALIWAAKRGYKQIIQLLLKHGSDITLRNYDGLSAVEVASPAIKMLLLDIVEGSTESSHRRLLQAAWQGNFAVINKLLSDNKVLDINCQNADGLTPILLLVRDMQLFERLSSQLNRPYHPIQVLQELISHRADIYASDADGKTCLHLACQSKTSVAGDLMSELVRAGAQTEVRDKRCFTPIHCASQSGNADVLSTLAGHGSDVNARGFAGTTPLHITAYNDHERAAVVLLEHGADIMITDDQGQTAMDVARGKKLKSRLKVAWSEATQNKAEPTLAPVRSSSVDGVAATVAGRKASPKTRKGEVVFDGIPADPFAAPSSPKRVSCLTNAEKADHAEEVMFRDIDAGQFSPAPYMSPSGIRRLGKVRAPTQFRPPSGKTAQDKLPPVISAEYLGRHAVRQLHRSATETALSGKLSNLSSTFPEPGVRRSMPVLLRDQTIPAVTNLGTELDTEIIDLKASGCQAMAVAASGSVHVKAPASPEKCHRRSFSDSRVNRSVNLADVAMSCSDIINRGHSVSQSDDQPELSPSTLAPNPLRATMPGRLTPSKRTVLIASDSAKLKRTPSQEILANSTFITQKYASFSKDFSTKIKPGNSQDSSPGTSDEFADCIDHVSDIKLANADVMELQRSRSLLKVNFILEESRPKDPLQTSSGSDSYDSVESNPGNSKQTSVVSRVPNYKPDSRQLAPSQYSNLEQAESKDVIQHQLTELNNNLFKPISDRTIGKAKETICRAVTEEFHGTSSSTVMNDTDQCNSHTNSVIAATNNSVDFISTEDKTFLRTANIKPVGNTSSSNPMINHVTQIETTVPKKSAQEVLQSVIVRSKTRPFVKSFLVKPSRLISDRKKSQILQAKQANEPVKAFKAANSSSVSVTRPVTAANKTSSQRSQAVKALSKSIPSSVKSTLKRQSIAVDPQNSLLRMSQAKPAEERSLVTDKTNINVQTNNCETVNSTPNMKPKLLSSSEGTISNSDLVKKDSNFNTKYGQSNNTTTKSLVKTFTVESSSACSIAIPEQSEEHLHRTAIIQTPIICNPFEHMQSNLDPSANITETVSNTAVKKMKTSSKTSSTKLSKKAVNGSSTNKLCPPSPETRKHSGKRRGAKSSDSTKNSDTETSKRPISGTKCKTKTGKNTKQLKGGKGKNSTSATSNHTDVDATAEIDDHVSSKCVETSDAVAMFVQDSDSSDDDDDITEPVFRYTEPFYENTHNVPNAIYGCYPTQILPYSEHFTTDLPNAPTSSWEVNDRLHVLPIDDEFDDNYDYYNNNNTENLDISIFFDSDTDDNPHNQRHLLTNISAENCECYYGMPYLGMHPFSLDDYGLDVNEAIHRELLLSKLSPIPEGNSLISQTINTLDDFSKTVQDNTLNDLIDRSRTFSREVTGLSDTDVVLPPMTDEEVMNLVNDQTPFIDPCSGLTYNALDRQANKCDSTNHPSIEGVAQNCLSKQKSGDNVLNNDEYLSREKTFTEVKDENDRIDEMVEEILTSTEPSSIASTLKSRPSFRSHTGTLTKAERAILHKLVSSNDNSPFHASTNKASSVTHEDLQNDSGNKVAANPSTNTEKQMNNATLDSGAVDEAKQIERIIHSVRQLELHARIGNHSVVRSMQNTTTNHIQTHSSVTSIDKLALVRPHSAGCGSVTHGSRRSFKEIRGARPDAGLQSQEPLKEVVRDEPMCGSHQDTSAIERQMSTTSEASSVGYMRSDSACSTQSGHSSMDDATIQWKKGNILGKGAFGTVWCGLTNEGGLIAVKQIELNTSDMNKAKREYEKVQEEVELLKTLQHKNIVGYLGTSLESHMVNIFMQFVPGGSIANLLARFGALDETVFCHYARQILQGVEYLHNNGVIHRDIKGANVMLMPTGVIKLIDFGCAKRLCLNLSMGQTEILKSMKGTPYWMAPEVVNETGHGKKSDIWSIGCTVFEMATKKPPWSHMNPMAAIFAIGCGGQVPQLSSTFSREARDFVNACLTRDQHCRLTATALLNHAFIRRKKHSNSTSKRL